MNDALSAQAFAAHVILSILDEACARGRVDPRAWPRFRDTLRPHDDGSELAALRLYGFRAAKGRGWGVVLARLSGGEPSSWRVDCFLYGSNVAPGLVPAAGGPAPVFVLRGPKATLVEGPAGALEIRDELIDALDLRPGEGCAPRGGGEAMVCLRAYLEVFPDAVWPDPRRLATALGLATPQGGGEDAAAPLIAVSNFEHVEGAGGLCHGAEDARLPSASPAFCSLARVLVGGDVSLFDAGEPNTSWRAHVGYDADAEHGRARWLDAEDDLKLFDGEWSSEMLRLAFRLQGREGRAARTEGGEIVLRVARVCVAERAFEGQQRLADGRVLAVRGSLRDDDTLLLDVDGHTVVLHREISWSFG